MKKKNKFISPSITQLYRHFNSDGQLLYVGISLSAVSRLRAHKSSSWASSIARVDVKTFSTREEALVAERLAIQTEYPMHNRAMSCRPADEDEDTITPNVWEGHLLASGQRIFCRIRWDGHREVNSTDYAEAIASGAHDDDLFLVRRFLAGDYPEEYRRPEPRGSEAQKVNK
jgi:predicted GIY-YIG superfamily endonuclease